MAPPRDEDTPDPVLLLLGQIRQQLDEVMGIVKAEREQENRG